MVCLVTMLSKLLFFDCFELTTDVTALQVLYSSFQNVVGLFDVLDYGPEKTH